MNRNVSGARPERGFPEAFCIPVGKKMSSLLGGILAEIRKTAWLVAPRVPKNARTRVSEFTEERGDPRTPCVHALPGSGGKPPGLARLAFNL